MSDETRKHEFELMLDAPVELVWWAVSTGEGIQQWFAPSAEVKPGLGGEVTLSWGPGMEGTAPITDWAEGAKLAWTEDHGERGKRVVEFVLEAVGGKTRLRLVHSGFGAGASFDDEFDSTNGGWLTFLACLRYYVEEMRGAAGRHVWRMSMPDREPGAVWAKLVKGLGMAGQDWSVGARYTATIPGGGRFSGVVVAAPKRGYAVLRVDELGGSALALFCEACGGGCAFTASWYLYGTGLDPDCALLSDWNRYYDALSVKRGEAG